MTGGTMTGGTMIPDLIAQLAQMGMGLTDTVMQKIGG